MLNRDELKICGKLVAIVIYAVALYLASTVLTEAYSVFEYGRF